jgi:hypothetical protein
MSRLEGLIYYNLVVLEVIFYFLFQYFHKSPVVATFIFLFLRMVLFSSSEALVGSQRMFVPLECCLCAIALTAQMERTDDTTKTQPAVFLLVTY